MQELLLQGLALRLPLNNITIQKRQKCRNCCSTMPSARLPFSGSKVFVCSPSRCIFVLVLSTFFFSILQVFFPFVVTLFFPLFIPLSPTSFYFIYFFNPWALIFLYFLFISFSSPRLCSSVFSSLSSLFLIFKVLFFILSFFWGFFVTFIYLCIFPHFFFLRFGSIRIFGASKSVLLFLLLLL